MAKKKKSKMRIGESVRLNHKGKSVKGFIIAEVNGHYKIGTHMGIVYRKKDNIEKW